MQLHLVVTLTMHDVLLSKNTRETFVETAIVDYGSMHHSIFIDIFFCVINLIVFPKHFALVLDGGKKKERKKQRNVVETGFLHPLMSLGLMQEDEERCESDDNVEQQFHEIFNMVANNFKTKEFHIA